MNIKCDISEDQFVTLTVELTSEDMEKELIKAQTEFRSKVNIPGFRRGKAPMNMVMQRHGSEFQSFFTDKTEDIIRDNAIKAISEQELQPGGGIDLNLLESKEDQLPRFEVKFALYPEVKLTNYKGLSISVDYAEISESDIDREIEAQRKRSAMLRSIDTEATADAHIKLKMQEIDPSGLPLIGREVKEVDFEFGMDQLGIGSDEQLMGIKAGEKRTIIVKNNDIVSPAEPESVIIKPGEESKSTTGSIHYSVEAEQVEVPELPEVNEDFAKSIDPQLNSVEELRKWMEIQLLSLVTYNSKRQLETRLISKLFEENPFPIHSSIIDSIIDNTIESEQMSEEERKKYVAENIKRIDSEFRWMLVSKEIGKLENMTVEEEDIENELLMIVQQTGKPMKEVKKFYKNKEDLNRLKSRMYDRKILEFLSENAEIEKKNMSLNEFASEFDAPY
ncbi:MAG: trigger factor [Calditrichaeota bacterium]|nr:trigger factor [Calditrichota bacterium]